MNADKNDETKINMIMEEANEQCEQMTTKILSIVLNEFPKKIEQIDKLRKKFDWKMILTLKRNDIKSISNMIVNQLMTIKQKNDQHHQSICIQNGEYKPFLFCLNESNNNNQNMKQILSTKNCDDFLYTICVKLILIVRIFDKSLKFKKQVSFFLLIQSFMIKNCNDNVLVNCLHPTKHVLSNSSSDLSIF